MNKHQAMQILYDYILVSKLADKPSHLGHGPSDHPPNRWNLECQDPKEQIITKNMSCKLN